MAGNKKSKKKVATVDVTEYVIHSLYALGILDDSDLEDRKKLNKKILLIPFRSDFNIIIDHRYNLLDRARFFYKEKAYDYAKMFYATFFEHSINGIIALECSKKKLSQNSQRTLLRQVPFDGKFG